MGIFMNTRHSGSESGHVTAELEAMTNEATLGAGNYVFEAGNKFAITVTPATGDINISNGVFSWCGRLGGVESFAPAKYTPPSSETLYKKVVVGARYTKNSSTLVENISLEVVESDVQASESAAAGVTLSLDSAEIKPDTTSAYLPLWEFIATSKTNTKPSQLFNYIENIEKLQKKVVELIRSVQDENSERKTEDNKLAQSIANEAELRRNADTAFNDRLSVIESRYETIAETFKVNTAYTVVLSKYRAIAFTIDVDTKISTNSPTPFVAPAIVGSYSFPIHMFTERSLGGFNVETGYITFTVSESSVKVNTTSNIATGNISFKNIYGIT